MHRHVVLVAPHFLPNTVRYIRAFVDLDDVDTTVISESPESALPTSLRERLHGHYRVPACMDARQLVGALRVITRALGKVDRLVGALEQLQLPLAEAREALGIPGMHSQVARNFRDKDRMKDVLREQGVPVAKSGLVESEATLRSFVQQLGGKVIVKPQAGLGARSTYRLESEADIDALVASGGGPTPARPLLVEEFVRAREHTCETVTIEGQPVWRSGTRYFPSPLEVLENPWMQYCVLLPREEDDETFTSFHPVNAKALSVLGMKDGAAGTALTHMEWFLKDDGSMLVSEVGARPPGVHIMPLMGLAHGVDMIPKWAELVACDRFEAPKRQAAAGAAFFRGQGKGDRIVAIHGVEEARARVDGALVDLTLPALGTPRASSYEGEGSATVRHATTEGVKDALRTLVSTIRLELG